MKFLLRWEARYSERLEQVIHLADAWIAVEGKIPERYHRQSVSDDHAHAEAEKRWWDHPGVCLRPNKYHLCLGYTATQRQGTCSVVPRHLPDKQNSV